MKKVVSHILKEFRTHKIDYLLFATACVFFLISVQIFKGERLLEFLVLLAFASFYIIWGLYHHIIEGSVQLKTIVEYVLIGFIVIFLAKLIIFP